MDLFTQLEEANKQIPLAELMRPKNLDDFPHLNCLIDRLNKPMEEKFGDETFTSDSPWKLSLRVDVDEVNGSITLEILDECEELYYEGFRFEKTMEQLEEALRKDTDDSEAYFDCVCPGRWSADFKGRFRYSLDDIKHSIHCAAYNGILDYMQDTDNKPNWDNGSADKIDSKIDEILELVMEVFAK